MAKIVRSHFVNTVRQNSIRLWGTLGAILAGGALLAGFAWKLAGVFPALAVLAAAAALALWMRRKISITAAGARGEEQTLRLLRGLPEGYSVLPDLTIQYKSHRSQVDYLILTPARIVILECKNVSGMVEGGENSQNWRQRKIRGGKVYEEKEFYNPLRQVSGHRMTLCNLLREAELSVPVETAVFFSNPNAVLKVRVPGAHLFTIGEKEALLRYLEEDRRSHSTYDQKKVIRLIRHS